MSVNNNYSGKTLLKDWWKIVASNFNTLQVDLHSHSTAVDLNHPNKSVKKRHIDDGAVGKDQIEDYSVSQEKLAQYSVSSAKIYPSAVLTAHIKNGNVTYEKLADGSVKESKISDDAVTETKIMDGAVVETKLDNALKRKTINYMHSKDTYIDTANNMNTTVTGPLFRIYSSKHAAITGAPSDNTAGTNGYIEYLVLQVPIYDNERTQIALNINSRRKFIRRIVSGTPGDWAEI